MPANVAPEHIVRRPVLSEKSTSVMNDQKRYTFEVDPRATKTEIKAAIQTIYKVRVIGINTTLRQARTRTTKSGKVDGTITKKAVIRLHADDAIELF